MYVIRLTHLAEEQLKKLDVQIKSRILNAFDRIKIRPEAYIEKLVGDPAYKLRVGDYRVIVDLNKNELLILVIKLGHRKNIYKN